MVKHNNTTKSGHFKKSWQKKVKTGFKSPSKKIKRRINRNEKKWLIPKILEIKSFRPIVHCPTRIHNLRVKMGRGFSNNEILNSGCSRKVASSIGISIDKRRKNRKKNRFFNVDRLREYFGKFTLLEKKRNSDMAIMLDKAVKKILKKPLLISEKFKTTKLECVYNLSKKKSYIQSYRIIINQLKKDSELPKKNTFSNSSEYGKRFENGTMEHLFNWGKVQNFY